MLHSTSAMFYGCQIQPQYQKLAKILFAYQYANIHRKTCIQDVKNNMEHYQEQRRKS
jgi:hypothetical protein